MAAELIRGTLVSFSGTPAQGGADAVQHIEDGVLALNRGRIEFAASAADFVAQGGNLDACEDLRPAVILPGFIDAHVHFPQVDIIASFGTQLMDWLERYAFPAEAAFADADFAAARAERFLELSFAHGTTSALVFTTGHEVATEALFRAAQSRGARLIAGQVLADRNVPPALLDDADAIATSARLIERWHGVARLSYAVTPRFAITSSAAQLRAAGTLLERYPGVLLHTHLSENAAEIERLRTLFPAALDYVDVYERHGLVGERSVFAHGVHLCERERHRLAARGAAVVFCPSSNLFLGSGLCDLATLQGAGVRLAVGSDVGAGTSLSMLKTLADGYRVCQLKGQSWHPFDAFHAITLGNAITLGVDDRIGRLAPGFEADVVVLEPSANPALARRLTQADTLAERLFAYMMLGDERDIERTYVAGQRVWQRGAN